MANEEHVARLKEGAVEWNDWRKKRYEVPDLRWANLSGADLTGAHLSDANLSGAFVGLTVLGNVDLSVAKGLDRLEHNGPSTIGIDTVYNSGGRFSVREYHNQVLQTGTVPLNVLERQIDAWIASLQEA